MTEAAAEIEALSRGLIVTDASRRVGWAKAYEAADLAEQHAKDSNLFRGDRDAYRKGFSYLLGFLTAYTDGTITQTTLGDLDEMGLVADPKLQALGYIAGETTNDAHATTQERRAAKKERARDNQKILKVAQDLEQRRLAKRYGFEDPRDFREFLEAHRREIAGE